MAVYKNHLDIHVYIQYFTYNSTLIKDSVVLGTKKFLCFIKHTYKAWKAKGACYVRAYIMLIEREREWERASSCAWLYIIILEYSVLVVPKGKGREHCWHFVTYHLMPLTSLANDFWHFFALKLLHYRLISLNNM